MEDKKTDSTDPEQEKPAGWVHDQELSFKKVVPHLHVLKDALQKTINHEKARLAQMVGARDSIRK